MNAPPLAALSPPHASKRQLAALFLSVFMGLFGFGVVLPVFPFWGRLFGATASDITIAIACYSLGQFLGAPLWGRLSDRIGRRPVLIYSMIGSVLGYGALAFAGSIMELGAARLFAGLMAGNIAAALAYVGDITTPEQRPRAMGLLGAAFGLGFIFGPAVGGLVAGDLPSLRDAANVAWVAAGISIVAAIGMVAFLPESLPPERRRAAKAALTGGNMFALVRRKPAIGGLMAITLLVIGSAGMMETVFAIFAADRLGWGPRDVGLSFGMIGIIAAALQAGGSAPLAARFGSANLLWFSTILYGIALAALAMANTSVSVLAALAFSAIGFGLFNPALQTLTAATSDDSDRGRINGLTQGASAMGRIIGPAGSGFIYDGLGPHMPFAIGAGVMALAFVLARLTAR